MFVRRGAAAAVVVSAVLLLGAGCEDPAPKAAGATRPSASTSPSASVSAPASPSTAAVMPSVVGKGFSEAETAVKALVTRPVEARSAYSDVTLAAAHGAWTVCFQTPAGGAPVAPDTAVELSLVAPGTPCPGKAGAALHPSKAPAPAASTTPVPAPKPKATVPTDTGSTGGDGGNGDTAASSGGGGSDAYYSNCAAARAAGAAPIRRGEPGYRKALDRDNDGIACDK
ncbi:excalibur calcium-binding domain-containing protein [Streptomyces sp. NPDC006529]|uniref:excalibur calcium-binding domain-containing protein n=1 Tax=Streptomyces sp. NPDC006529 TaxID=3157177 RepID=UPI0033A766EF